MGKMLSNKLIRRKAWGLACRSFLKVLALTLVGGLVSALLIAIPAVCLYYDLDVVGYISIVPIVLFLPVLQVGLLKAISNIWSGKRMRLFHSLFCFTPKFYRIWGIMILTELILLGVMLPWLIGLAALFFLTANGVSESVVAAMEAASINVKTAATAQSAATLEAVLSEGLMTAIASNPGLILGMVAIVLGMVFVLFYMSIRLSTVLPAFVLNPDRRAGQCIKLGMRASKRNAWRIFCNGFMLALPMILAEILIAAINYATINLDNIIVISVITVITLLIEMLMVSYVMLGEFGLARQLVRKQSPKRKALPAAREH